MVCHALDVANLTPQQVKDAADQQGCASVQASDSDVMQTLVNQDAKITVGVCILHEIFAALSKLDGGFTGCLNTEIDTYYLKV